MISVKEASTIIQSHPMRLSTELVPVQASVGRVLAETIVADRHFPPFHRVAMDGIAIHHASFTQRGHSFFIAGMQAAGSPQLVLTDLANCVEVMTGAMLPQNTNAVIRYEDIEIKDGRATVLLDAVTEGMNIHRLGQDAVLGEVLLSPGQPISSAEVAVLASVGKAMVSVFRFPKTAVVSSGDELVDMDKEPLAHQIRRSNTIALQAAMAEMHWPSALFHLPDNEAAMKQHLAEILHEHAVLILSGGVSKGKFDFIPNVLEALGIQKQFHQVAQRPGKPFWFGASADKTKLAFALPGNPVSTFMCFFKFIKPWVLSCCQAVPQPVTARLAEAVTFAAPLTYFLPVSTTVLDGIIEAHPYAGGGSGDFVNLKTVDGFLELPAEKSTFNAHESYPFISFRV